MRACLISQLGFIIFFFNEQLTRFRGEERIGISCWKQLMLFQFAFCPLSIYILAGHRDYPPRRRCCRRHRADRPARKLLPVEKSCRRGSVAQPFEDFERRNLSCSSRARARANRSLMYVHTHAQSPGIINTPICLHSSSYKVSQTHPSVARLSVRPSVRPRSRFFSPVSRFLSSLPPPTILPAAKKRW